MPSVLKPKTAVDTYDELLEHAMDTKDFYAAMISMIQTDPYFFAPHLEMLDYLDVRGMPQERRSLLQFAHRKAREFLRSPALLHEARSLWTQKEGDFLLEILRKSPSTRRELTMRQFFRLLPARSFRASLLPTPTRTPKNLVLIKKGLDVSLIQKEIANQEILWVINTARQDSIAHHHDTNAIVLRAMPNKTETFTAIDGAHESTRTPLAQLFPRTVELIENTTSEMRGGLGRVALVRLKPHSLVYRHFDGEPWLHGRNRYHIVIQSKNGSFMTSGRETETFSEGDLFLFNNKVMHTAENRSDEWRIHAIFDMKVPAQYGA